MGFLITTCNLYRYTQYEKMVKLKNLGTFAGILYCHTLRLQPKVHVLQAALKVVFNELAKGQNEPLLP